MHYVGGLMSYSYSDKFTAIVKNINVDGAKQSAEPVKALISDIRKEGVTDFKAHESKIRYLLNNLVEECIKEINELPEQRRELSETLFKDIYTFKFALQGKFPASTVASDWPLGGIDVAFNKKFKYSFEEIQKLKSQVQLDKT